MFLPTRYQNTLVVPTFGSPIPFSPCTKDRYVDIKFSNGDNALYDIGGMHRDIVENR